MSARSTIGIGVVSIALLASALFWIHAPTSEASDSATATLKTGQSVATIDGVDHLVETMLIPAGFSSLDEGLNVIGVELAPEDHFTAIPDPGFGVGSVVTITRATTVTILDGKDTTDRRTWVHTVNDLLAEAQISLGEHDRIEPSLETTLKPDLAISITRVGVSEESKTEEIAFKTITKQDNGLEKGKTRVEHVGRVGLKRLMYSVTRENGEETGRKLIRTETVREPQEKIVVEGTKVISLGSGQATWYGLKTGMGAAHNTLPKGTRVKVTNLSNSKSVDVVINDHGIQGSAIIDLTKEAFAQIAPLGAGRIQVKLEKDYD